MDRRAILGVLGLVRAPLVATAQPLGRPARVGFLTPSSESSFVRQQTLVDKILRGARVADLPSNSPRSSRW